MCPNIFVQYASANPSHPPPPPLNQNVSFATLSVIVSCAALMNRAAVRRVTRLGITCPPFSSSTLAIYLPPAFLAGKRCCHGFDMVSGSGGSSGGTTLWFLQCTPLPPPRSPSPSPPLLRRPLVSLTPLCGRGTCRLSVRQRRDIRVRHSSNSSQRICRSSTASLENTRLLSPLESAMVLQF